MIAGVDLDPPDLPWKGSSKVGTLQRPRGGKVQKEMGG